MLLLHFRIYHFIHRDTNQFNFLYLCFALRPPPRPSPVVRLSESSDLSDPLEELPRLNSDTALEAINGVQPELQCTPKDSEIYSKFLFSYFFFVFKFINLQPCPLYIYRP